MDPGGGRCIWLLHGCLKTVLLIIAKTTKRTLRIKNYKNKKVCMHPSMVKMFAHLIPYTCTIQKNDI